MTPEQTLDWLAQQHFDQCREERPIQDWMRKMKSQLPTQPDTGMLHIDRLERWLDASLKERKRLSLTGFDWLPQHKCGLHLSHNEHRDVYETIEEFYDADDFISPEEWHEAVAKDSVWVLHWYPNTPVGFIRIAASTLEAIEAKLKGMSHD